MSTVMSSIHQASFNALIMCYLKATVRQRLSVTLMTRADGRC